MIPWCMSCGRPIMALADRPGETPACPHCGQPVEMTQPVKLSPAEVSAFDTEETDNAERDEERAEGWLENTFSALASGVIHMTLLIVIALIPLGNSNAPGDGYGEEFILGSLPGEPLAQGEDDSLDVLDTAEVMRQASAVEQFEETAEIESPVGAGGSTDAESDLSLGVLSASGGDGGGFDLGAGGVGGGSGSGSGGSGGGGNWEGMVQGLRRNGLDIVILFDSTGSMSGEINQVKEQISRIGSILVRMIPKARISICTYRDQGDEYLTRGMELNGDVSEVSRFLYGVDADGGGDHPEAVHAGLQWAINNNQFRGQARKVILLFGDAPPHRDKLQFCLAAASDFHRDQNGIVSTVTCRSSAPLPEFYEIARAGGGEAFLSTDERQIMTQLMVLVFGSRHREKVIEAFKFLEP